MSNQNIIDASGNIIDASGNILDGSGNIIFNINNNSNNTIIEGATSFFSVFNEIKTLSVNYYLDYEQRNKKYLKRLDFEVNNNNDLIDISSIIIIEPKSINDDRTFENSSPDYIINDISKVTIDIDYSKYINGIILHPGKWLVGISEYYYDDPSFNIIDQKTFTIPLRDFLYNNKKLDFFREEVDNQKLFINVNKNELLNFRNNNKDFFNFLGRQETTNSSYLKSFFELITWFPENEKTISNTENSWELPDDYQGVGDNRLQFSPTYYLNDGTFVLSNNLSDFNEPGFKYSKKTLNRRNFFLNKVVNIQKVDANDSSTVIKNYNTLSEQYYLVQQEKNFMFSNFIFKSLVLGYDEIYSWVAEIFISPDTKIKNAYENGIETKLTDCSGAYSYSVIDSNSNILFTLGLIGTGELIEGDNEQETENNKQKSYIFKDKNQQTYQVRLSDYNIIYDPIEKTYDGGFSIKYVFRERKIITTEVTYYIDVYIFINNIYFTKIIDGGVKLNDINYWGYYGNNDNDMLESVTFVYQTLTDQAYIDDDYSIKDKVTWKKYVPTIETDILLSDFDVQTAIQINAPSEVENETDYIGSISAGGFRHTAILLDTGEVMTTGSDLMGALGINNASRTDPYKLVSMNAVAPYDKTNAISVACSYGNTYILLNTGEVMGCGMNNYGDLGVGDTTERSELVSMNAIAPYDKTNAVSISAFWQHFAILLKTGEIMTCGRGGNYGGQLGVGDQTNKSELVSMNTSGNYDKTNAISVTVSYGNTFILLNTGEVMGCGMNRWYGQLGNNSTNDEFELVSMNASGNYDKTNAIAISAGSDSVVVLLNTGEVMTCGSNDSGQLAVGGGPPWMGYELYSVISSGNYDKTNAVAISSGSYHFAILLNTGEVMTCGSNHTGPLGLGDGASWAVYELVSMNASGNYDKTNAVAIAVGYYQTKIILDTGEVVVCGSNSYGQLADGTNVNKSELVSMSSIGNYDKTNINSTKYTEFDIYKLELTQNIITSNYPRYITYNGESTTKDSIKEFELTMDMGNNNGVYIEVEDIGFSYRINNADNDKLRFELSNDGTNWVIPGEESIYGIDWLYKKFIRNDTVVYTMPNSRLESSISIYENITYPVKILNWSSGSNYDISQNSEIIFDTGNNTLKYILINKLSFALNQLNDLGYDELSISYSDDNISWVEPEIDWCYKKSINIETPNKIIKLDDTTTKLSTQIAYGYGNNELYPVTFTDSGGLGDTSQSNYKNDENYKYFFDAGENNNISILIKEIRIENNSDQLIIFGSNTMSLSNLGEATYNWEPLTVSFFKTGPNYATATDYNGHFFTFSKIQINAFLKNNILDDIILNTGYRFIKFSFISNNDNVYGGWNFTIYKTKEYLENNGNVFPETINVPNDKVIETNYKYIKFNFISDSLFTDTGFDLEIYKKDNYENKYYGNTFPETIKKAKEITDIENFDEINSFKYDYRYIKFKYNRETSDLFNDTNRWKIRIDNKSKTYREELLDITKTQPQEFKENVYKKAYPVKFKPDKLNNLDYPIAVEYGYLFDAGENNTINIEYNTFDISHNIEIDGQVKGSLEKDGGLIINNKFTLSYSNDNINWEPARVSWMHKTNSFIGNTAGGRRVANYYNYYDEDNRLITPANVVSWYDDTDGFLLPSNKDKAKEIYLNKYKNIVDISWNKINKIYTNYRYVKFLLLFETSEDKYNSIDWDIDIHIKQNKGENNGIIPNYNSINSFERNNCVYSINYEINSSELNIPLFKSNNKFIKNGKEIPYICRYDYRLLDLSNNIILESNIDTDIYDDIYSLTANYNGKREGKEYSLIPKSTKDSNELVNIQQKYYYTSKFFSNRILSNTLYIPDLGDYHFFTVNKTLVLTIPKIKINQIKENIVSFWRGNEYPTYFNLVLYIWYPWSEKYKKYINSYDSVRSDMRYLLDDNLCDEVMRITIDEGIYYDTNLVGVPNNNVFKFDISQFNGRYIFCWSYEIKQENGLYDDYTPAKYFYDFDYNNMYLPNIEILNITDFITDDYIYDPLEPELKYIENNYNTELDISYSKINISLSNEEIISFNDFLYKHEKALNSVSSGIKNIKVKFYIWTPNNESSNNQDGWELPDDYFGFTDPRISSTPYYFENKPNNVISDIWDPSTILNRDKIFGFNLDSSGVIIKEFSFNKKSFVKSDLAFDISFSSIYISPDDLYFTDYLDNKDVPNPYFYKKNNVRGIPYLSRWEYEIVEDVKFKNASIVSIQDILLDNNYNLNSITNKYNGDYPITFYDDGGLNNGYNNSLEREIIFEAPEGETICIQINDFEFNHDLTDTNNIELKDRLALLVSDDNLNFEPAEISWFFKSGLYGGDNSGNNLGSSFLNSEPGFIFPANKLIALKKYYNSDTITRDTSFNEINLIELNKRYIKFRFISSSVSVLNNEGWEIKVFTKDVDENKISSKIIFQKGGLGNISTDFNYKFKFNADIYLELDKSIKQENPGILDYKDFLNDGISVAYMKGYNFYIINNSNVIWQFVIKKPPTDYVFDILDENGNIINETQKTLENQTVLTQENENLTYEDNIEDNTIISGIQMSFNETSQSSFIDKGRKFVLYIRKSTDKEKIFFKKFKKGSITQIENNTINNRITDWYPLNTKFNLTNNNYRYGKLLETKELDLEQEQEIIIEDTIDIQLVDNCGLCRDITKTKEIKTSKQRYSDAVKINFTLASRLRGSNICN